MNTVGLAKLISLKAQQLEENVTKHQDRSRYPFSGGEVGYGSSAMACTEQARQLRRDLLLLIRKIEESK